MTHVATATDDMLKLIDDVAKYVKILSKRRQSPFTSFFGKVKMYACP